MSGNRAIVGLCMLCAIVFSAFAAQSASAKGTTAYTCAETGTGDFKDAHCKEAGEAGKSKYAHVPFEGTTKITGTNVTTGTSKDVTKLKSVQAGVTLELQSQTLDGEGEMSNKLIKNKAGEEEMVAHGTGFITYTEVTVTAPAGKGCKVKTEEVKTNELTATTQEQTNQLNFTPAAGETFAEFTVEGCSIAALNHLYTAKGSVKGTIEGATTRTTHAGTTEQNTLTLSGQKAGIEGSLTIKGPNGNGLTVTPG
jgi:hypothetical protein